MFISTYNQLIDVLLLWKGNLGTYQTEVGATAADITWANQTLQNLLYVQDYCATADANKKANYDIKQSFFNGEKGALVSDFPVSAAALVPNPPLVGGALFKERDLAARFKLGPGYTNEIGIALGIASEPGPNVPEASVKPTLEVFAAQTGYVFSAVVAGRVDADQWEVQILRSGSTVWQTVKVATGKSSDVTVTPTTPGMPEQIQVRVQLKRNNENYGQLSDAATVTINP